MKRVLIAAGMLALLCWSAGPVRADLIVNGGFETGNFAGWTQSGNTGFDFVGNSPNPPHSGNFAAQLGAVGSTSTTSQTFKDNPGTDYTLSFWESSAGGTPNFFQASLDGNPLFTATNAPAHGMTQHVFNFVGTGSDTVAFTARNDPSWLGLDDVSVVPEPTSLLLFGVTGLFASAYVGLRRRAALAV